MRKPYVRFIRIKVRGKQIGNILLGKDLGKRILGQKLRGGRKILLRELCGGRIILQIFAGIADGAGVAAGIGFISDRICVVVLLLEIHLFPAARNSKDNIGYRVGA